MTVSSDQAVSVGFDAGWRADFRAEGAAPTAEPAVRLGRDDYDADLRVSFDASFRAATFSLVVEGIQDRDYRRLVGGPCPLVSLALGWRDAPGTVAAGFAPLAGALGLGGAVDALPEVLAGRVTAVQQSAGDYRYPTTFTGIDAAFARLRTTRSDPTRVDVAAGSPLIDYLTALCAQADVRVVGEGDQPPLDGRLDVPADVSLDQVVLHLAQVARGNPDNPEVQLFLRGGRLHVGGWEGPVDGGRTHRLDASTGLVDAVPKAQERTGLVPDDPYATAVADACTVTLLGRSDIAVGDVVVLALPELVPVPVTTGSALGGLGVLAARLAGGNGPELQDPRPFRVLSVVHQLGRTTGFSTTLEVERQQPPTVGTGDGARATEEDRLAEALDARARRLAAHRRVMDIGLVNRQSTAAHEDGSMTVQPQRLQLRSGLASHAAPNVPVLAAPSPAPTQLVDKPYLTPFAFGRTGLVLPHYPGSRVLHLNHDDDVRNAVVAGCLWEDGEEPTSRPGDWWLTLPTGVAAAESSARPEAEAPEGKVSSDLIDGAGGRDIAVSGLRISVGQDHLPDVGTRPDSATPDEIVIRSAHGQATIRVDGDGNIEISTDAEIRFRARKVTFDVDDSVEVG